MSGQFPLPFETAAQGWKSVDANVHPDAHLSRSAIGALAQVANVTLTECVVWPGARVDADHTRCIILPDGSVVAVDS